MQTLSESQRASINADEWINLVDDEPLKSIRQSFLNWAQEIEGKGLCKIRFGSKTMMIDLKGSEESILHVTDRAWFYLIALKKLGWDERRITEVRSRLEHILGLKLTSKKDQYPSTNLTLFGDKEKKHRLFSFLSTLMGEIVETGATANSGKEC